MSSLRTSLAIVVLLLLTACLAAHAQSSGAPAIFDRGVVNAASFMPPPVAGSGLAQGSLISIFGSGLGPEPGVSAGSYPLATVLGGVSVEVQTADSRTLAALPLYAGAAQINAVLPSETPVGLNLILVRRDGVASNAVAVKVVRGSFGIFTLGSGAVKQAVAQRFVSEQEQPLATFEAPARPGETVVLWGTGLGPVQGPETNPPEAGGLDTPLEVFVGHQRAAISYQGRAPCCSGVDQLNIRVPQDAPGGCFVPVWVSVRGSLHSNVASIPISADGSPCRDTLAGPAAVPSAPTGRVLLRRSVELDASMSPVDNSTRDLAAALFRSPAAALFRAPAAVFDSDALAPLISLAPLQAADLTVLPPEGTCLVYEPTASVADDGSAPLDAGNSLELEGPAGRTDIPRIPREGIPGEGIPRAHDDYRLDAPPQTLFLGAGTYRVAGSGGPGFPLFSATVQSSEPPAWTGIEGPESEPRLDGAVLTWATPPALPPDMVFVTGRDPQPQPPVDPPTAPPVRFVCTAAAAAESFTVPQAVIANLPESTATLELAGLWGPRPLEFLTDGPETGSLAYLHTQQTSARLGTPHLASTPIRLPNSVDIEAELAVTFSEQQRGLMFRRELPAGQGMLFLFSNAGSYSFWMLNTLVPLDIIWMDSERRIVFISQNTPPCPPEVALCPTYGGNEAAQFVLELAAGQAAANGLQVGDKLEW